MRIAILGTRGIPANYGGFETFAEEQAPQIEPMMKAANGTEVSEPTYWRELTTYDAFGWGA